MHVKGSKTYIQKDAEEVSISEIDTKYWENKRNYDFDYHYNF